MLSTVAILATVISIVGAIFLLSALRLLSRRVVERATRSAAARKETLAQIPVMERMACYASIALVVGSWLAFDWIPGGAGFRTLAVATGVAAVFYLVWFSVRWWHLK